MLIQKQTEQRMGELDDNIKMLNALFSDLTFKQVTANIDNVEQMFQDVMSRSYARFCKLDRETDRDVVDPLFKVARMMTFAHDKIESIKDVSKGKGNTDSHSQIELLELYKKRSEEILDEQAKRANAELQAVGQSGIQTDIDPDSIIGIEELGVSFEITE